MERSVQRIWGASARLSRFDARGSKESAQVEALVGQGASNKRPSAGSRDGAAGQLNTREFF